MSARASEAGGPSHGSTLSKLFFARFCTVCFTKKKKKKKSKICNVRINQRTVSRAFGFLLDEKGKGQTGRWLISLCDWCGSRAKCQQNETHGGVFLQAARGPGCIGDRVHAIGSRSSWVSSASAPRERCHHRGGTGLNPSAFFCCRCPTFTGSCAKRLQDLWTTSINFSAASLLSPQEIFSPLTHRPKSPKLWRTIQANSLFKIHLLN